MVGGMRNEWCDNFITRNEMDNWIVGQGLMVGQEDTMVSCGKHGSIGRGWGVSSFISFAIVIVTDVDFKMVLVPHRENDKYILPVMT